MDDLLGLDLSGPSPPVMGGMGGMGMAPAAPMGGVGGDMMDLLGGLDPVGASQPPSNGMGLEWVRAGVFCCLVHASD